MTRLIDADSIEYTHAVARSLDDGHNWNVLCVTEDEIQDMPTVDAMPVIWCKDCKHCVHEVYEDLTPYGFYNERHCFFCKKHFDEEMGELREVMLDDYCSWAERKEE